MKLFAFFALLLCSANVLAQTPAEQIAKLQNDPNIIWIGEFYRDYEDLDNGYEGRNIDRYRPDTLPDGSILHGHSQNTSVLKLERRIPAAGKWKHYFWAQVIDPQTKIFADADLSKPISDKDRKNYVMGKDTVDSFDPETFAPLKAVWEYELNPENICAYRLRQLVYYNAQENMYYNLPLSIAPIMIEGDKNGNRIGTKPLFWLPVISNSAPINPSKAANMPFIKSVQMHFPFADAKVLKESKKIEAVNKVWRESIIAQKDKIFAVGILNLDNENQKPLSSKEINDVFFAPDTIIVTDSITFIDSIKPIIREINIEIIEVRINQTFGWDDKKKIMTVATYSIAPIMNRYNEYNNLMLYSGPRFYLYPHRRFKIAK